MPFTKTEVDVHTDYVVETVDPDWLAKGVKSPKHLMLDPDNCILCRACEDVCPWNCIYMMSTDIVQDAEDDAVGAEVHRVLGVRRRRQRVHAVLGVRRPVPHRHAVLCAAAGGLARAAHDGLGARVAARRGRLGGGRDEGDDVAKLKLPTPGEALDRVRETEVWKSIFRPGSIFRRGYRDTSRDRALATMNNVLYHLHPVKMKRHGLKLTYTFCLGGLSFFLFILLTITGIYLMFFYRPAAELGSAAAYTDMQNIRTSVFFGDLVRNLHRWGAHLMVFSVTLHMARVFYTGSYKPPREFNWVVGVLLFLTLGLSFTGYLLPWDQLAVWAVTVGPRSPATRR